MKKGPCREHSAVEVSKEPVYEHRKRHPAGERGERGGDAADDPPPHKLPLVPRVRHNKATLRLGGGEGAEGPPRVRECSRAQARKRTTARARDRASVRVRECAIA